MIVSLPTSRAAPLLVSSLVLLCWCVAGCDRGAVGSETVSICVPEGACDPTMFEQGLHDAPADLEIGRSIFDSTCATCHGPGGKGLGPTARIDFTQPVWHARYVDKEIAEIIRKGRPPTMPAMPLADAQLRDVIAYLRSLKVVPAEGDAPGGY